MIRPPLLARVLLRLLVRGEDGEFIAGDLLEDFEEKVRTDGPRGARAWYRSQVGTTVLARAQAWGRSGEWTRECRFALRRIRRDPGYGLVVLVTLGLGIGGTVAVGSIARTVLQPLPFPDPEQLVSVRETRDGVPRSVAPANYLDWRAMSQAFSGLAAVTTGGASVTVDDVATRERISTVSGNFFEVLGIEPLFGRGFDPAFDLAFPGREVVLGRDAAIRFFGSESAAVGRTILIDDLVYDVVGVMPSSFRYPDDAVTAWVRSPTEAPEIRGLPFSIEELRDAWFFDVVGRLESGRTIEAARTEMDQIARRLTERHPDTNTGAGVLLVPILDETVADFDRVLIALGLAVLLILAGALFNVLHLTLARSETKRADAAVRLSLGATRSQLARSFLVEGWLLGAGGAVVGIVLATWGVRLAADRLGDAIPRAMELGLPIELVGVGIGLGIGAGTLLGVATLAAAAPDRDLRGRLRSGRGGRALVAVQVGVSIAVLTGTALLARSFERLGRVDLGFSADGLVTARLSIPDAPSLPYAERLQIYERVAGALEAAPGITSVALGDEIPLRMGMQAGVHLDGAWPEGDPPNSGWQPVAVGYFETFGMSLLQGRTFDARDGPDGMEVAVVNEAFVRNVLDGAPALGRVVTMGLDSHDVPLTIVGVVADTRSRGPAVDPGPVLYRPLAQTERFGATSMLVAARMDDTENVAAVRGVIQAVAPGLPAWQFSTGRDLIRPFRATQAMLLAILGLFGVAALLIGAVGVYGVGMHSVRRARREIGVRLALGATERRITGEVLRRGMASALIGVPPGLVVAWLVGRSVEGLLFGVSANDPRVAGLVTLGILTLTAVAFLAPARVAAAVDPASATRSS